MPTESKKPGFAVKRQGYGAGLPIAWEGWLILSVYVGVVVAATLLLHALVSATVIILLTVPFVYICRQKSDEEWRWR